MRIGIRAKNGGRKSLDNTLKQIVKTHEEWYEPRQQWKAERAIHAEN